MNKINNFFDSIIKDKNPFVRFFKILIYLFIYLPITIVYIIVNEVAVLPINLIAKFCKIIKSRN
ncbi:MAG: hypothetical protein COT81_02280 [Candidatus Buchananbacteria bacterium CG10_big_fil_rev_8_21_14_0_10_42_9]|uniref:Uncharacterized protein n=1 Tax=Candidatus Buchananbacteria bacterium CG10_big_fil_rev_8_21_14_0_10_42_9 TaxID=1974526 RepID=A0A2H0W1K5_9BACT|nr:MAG: hypothetical protein COT81_02280 [Candidatus Buchananbacteria bacterium CG10_big_fil_rev_8_21_14_0_10_42_9]